MFTIRVKGMYIARSFSNPYHFQLTPSLLKAKIFSRERDCDYRLRQINNLFVLRPNYKKCGAVIGKVKRGRNLHVYSDCGLYNLSHLTNVETLNQTDIEKIEVNL